MKNSPTPSLAALAAISTLLSPGCDDTSTRSPDPIAPEVFVSVMAELAQVQQFPPRGIDAAAREAQADSLRAAILERFGITADQLLAFARSAGADPARMEVLADRIATAADSLALLRDPPEPASDSAALEREPTQRPRGIVSQGEDAKSLRGRLDSLRREFGRTPE